MIKKLLGSFKVLIVNRQWLMKLQTIYGRKLIKQTALGSETVNGITEEQ